MRMAVKAGGSDRVGDSRKRCAPWAAVYERRSTHCPFGLLATLTPKRQFHRLRVVSPSGILNCTGLKERSVPIASLENAPER
eukprot:ctg_609.g277